MRLSEHTLQPILDLWSVSRNPAWTSQNIQDVKDKLVFLSELVLPRLVGEETLPQTEAQRFLLERTVVAIEDWLTRIASGIRRSHRIGSETRLPNGSYALGLRGATIGELDGLPSIGEKKARELKRFLALQPEITTIDDLDAVEGIGRKMIEALSEVSYLDTPSVAFMSRALYLYAQQPSIANFLNLLDESGLEVIFGDATAMARRPPAGGAPIARFLRLLELTREEAAARLSPASGALASDAAAYLSRHDLRKRYLERLSPGEGELLISGEYVQAVQDRLIGARKEVWIMMFVATARAADEDGPGPLPIVETLERLADAGVRVRVILDQDEPTAPYKSKIINQPLVKRLRDAGMEVKLDTPSILLHSKLIVVDEEAVILGSHNLTGASMADTHEVSVLLEGTAIATAFAQRFETLWSSLT